MIRASLLAVLAAVLFFFLANPAEAGECATAFLDSGGCNTINNGAFEFPEIAEDSIFLRVPYARLADFTNVYPQPSRGVAPIRNAGDGFIWVTVNSWEKINGETWYQINPGEYVHEDDIRMLPASNFQGAILKEHPVRPFGWLVQDVVPSDEPDGEPNQAYAELPRQTFFQIFNVVLGDEDWLWYDIGDGRWVKQTYMSIIEASERPAEVGPDEFWTEVDLYEQTFAAYEGDRMVYATLISSGLNRWPTHEGLFQVWDRWDHYKMSGAEGKVDYYFIEDVPYIMYFDELTGIALHGTYWHDRFGYKHSHGCVNMPILDAEWIYNWSAEAPNDLWVWVHTSDPMNHLHLQS